ncbi:hypothetical protein PCK1_002592 [Pneumocystis canis]|nr:hypothetical protein PCK1_002592 [Pneumocystis canis]
MNFQLKLLAFKTIYLQNKKNCNFISNQKCKSWSRKMYKRFSFSCTLIFPKNIKKFNLINELNKTKNDINGFVLYGYFITRKITYFVHSFKTTRTSKRLYADSKTKNNTLVMKKLYKRLVKEV